MPKDTKQTNSSVANGSFDISQKCEVNVKLVSNTVEEITLQTSEKYTLK